MWIGKDEMELVKTLIQFHDGQAPTEEQVKMDGLLNRINIVERLEAETCVDTDKSKGVG